MKLLFYLFTVICLFIIIGCDDLIIIPGSGGENGGGCASDYRTATVDYRYMKKTGFDPDSFYTLYSDYLPNFTNAFTRGHVNVFIPLSYNNTVHGFSCPWRTIYNDALPNIDTLCWQLRNFANPNYFLVSIDNFTYDNQTNRLGVTELFKTGINDSVNTRRGWSCVFAGKISNFSDIDGINQYKAYATTHEMGHAIGFIHDEGQNCGTANNHQNCLMKYGATSNQNDPIRTSFTFCDYHVCSLYTHCNLTDLLTTDVNERNNILQKKNNLTYQILTNKTEYSECEPIALTLTVENSGNEIDSISYIQFEDFMNHIRITNSKNQEPLGVQYLSSFFRIPYTVIKPGEKISITKRLQDNYGYVDINRYYYFNEGRYSLQYYNGESKIASNNIQFNVIPLDRNNNNIKDEFLKIVKMEVFDINRKENDRLVQSWIEAKYDAIKKLMLTYPPNALTEEIYNYYNVIYGNVRMSVDMIDKNMWFINNYPNSYYLGDILYRTTHTAYYLKNGDSSANALLDSVISDLPGTNASLIAQKLKVSKQYKK